MRNAFRPHTVDELYRALDDARQNPRIGVVLLTGNGPSPKDGGWAFCSGGDQRIRGRDGYKYADGETATGIDAARSGRLHILEVQRLIRFMPKVVIAVVPGWAAGGGHSLHVVCDLTIASREHGRFKQTDADVGSFDAGYGSAYFARQVGQKFAREVFFLAEEYSAERAYEMGAVNAVVPHAELETTALAWANTILTQVAHRDPHAEVRLQRGRRRHGRPAGLRRRGHPPRLRHRRGGRGPRLVPREARPGLVPVPLAVLMTRPLHVVTGDILPHLRAALAGGPAILPREHRAATTPTPLVGTCPRLFRSGWHWSSRPAARPALPSASRSRPTRCWPALRAQMR